MVFLRAVIVATALGGATACSGDACDAPSSDEETSLLQVKDSPPKQEVEEQHLGTIPEWSKPQCPCKDDPSDTTEGYGACDDVTRAAGNEVTTPGEYEACWNERKFCCVSNSIVAHPMKTGPCSRGELNCYGPDNRIYYAGTSGWVTSSDTLEYMLRMLSNRSTSNMTVAAAYQILVGFPTFSESNKTLFVFKPKDDTMLAAPTFPHWFKYYQTDLGIQFPYKVMRNLTDAYQNISQGSCCGGTGDPIEVFQTLTGCKRECTAPYGAGNDLTHTYDWGTCPECGCREDVRDVAGNLSEYFGNLSEYAYGASKAGDPGCMSTFVDAFPSFNSAQLRMALHICNNIDPLFTGNGFGYNTILGPLGEQSCTVTPQGRTYGREFVVPNIELRKLVKFWHSSKYQVAIPLEVVNISDPAVQGQFMAGYGPDCKKANIP